MSLKFFLQIMLVRCQTLRGKSGRWSVSFSDDDTLIFLTSDKCTVNNFVILILGSESIHKEEAVVSFPEFTYKDSILFSLMSWLTFFWTMPYLLFDTLLKILGTNVQRGIWMDGFLLSNPKLGVSLNLTF